MSKTNFTDEEVKSGLKHSSHSHSESKHWCEAALGLIERLECEIVALKIANQKLYETAKAQEKESEQIVTLSPKTQYDRIRGMSVEELAQFLLSNSSILDIADNYICRKCKREHDEKCPVGDGCLFDWSDMQTVIHWLESEV